MRESNGRIFRPDAVRRYIQNREKSVLPRLVTPRTFILLWIFGGLLMISGFIAWAAWRSM